VILSEGNMTTRRGPKQKRRLREERSRRAVDAAVSLTREHGLRVEEPTVLNDLFSLMVHLKPAPVVARVATCMPRLRSPIAEWVEREIAVTTYLSGQGAPVVTPSRELPPGPHERNGFPISFWTYVEPDLGRTPTTDDCSAMLVDLHAALRAYPGELPMVCADDVLRGLELIDWSADLLDESDADLLRASAERLRPIWEAPGGEVRPLHGDAHPGNLIAARGGEVVWIDFEDVCLGPPEWDLATMMDEGAVAKYHDPDPEMLALCTELRTLQVALALIVFREDFGDTKGWDEGIRSMLDMLTPAS
jgi:aminoglycoside phosphotransferase (APT) family kinase protein